MERQSAVLGNVAVNTPREITQAEFNNLAKFAKQRGIRLDGSSDGLYNADFILNYFFNTWGVEITEQNLNFAWEKIHTHLKLYSQAAIEWHELEGQEPARASQLVNWLATQGKVGQLENQSDAAFTNLRLLLPMLRGYEISATTISHAIDRVLHSGHKLHFVPQPRRTEPMSRAAREDNGEPFLGRDVNLTAAEHRARARAAYAEPDKESPSTIRGREQAVAQQEAESMRGNSHSETSQLAKVFVYDQTNQQIDWIATRNARRQMQRVFEGRRAGSFRQV